jgi:hypothetical protein
MLLEKLRTGKEDVSRTTVTIYSEFQDEIILSGGECDAPSRSHLVSGGILVILHAYCHWWIHYLFLYVFLVFYCIRVWFRICFD